MNSGGTENTGPGEQPPGSCCVVGYGNAQRRDDGLGPYVINKLSQVLGQGAGVLLMARDQLDPDLVEDLRDAGEIILVDATIDYLPDGWQRFPWRPGWMRPRTSPTSSGLNTCWALLAGFITKSPPAGWFPFKARISAWGGGFRPPA